MIFFQAYTANRALVNTSSRKAVGNTFAQVISTAGGYHMSLNKAGNS